ncbi:hypothetical protein BU17DRAFT_72399 [Hysterangium stoloniferum]|nr:hypothetical protein BU17DRAFT_72399 [Hysterangium stoloniferum]
MEPINNAMGVKAQLLPWMVVVRRLLRRNGSPTDDNDCGWEGSEVKDAELDLGGTSTMYMATHSSFFAMVAVAKQLGRLPNALGGILGLLKMIRWLRGLITGRPVNDGGISDEFTPPDPNAPKPSKKPLIIIFLTLFSIPIHMYRLIGSHAARLPRMSMELIALAFEGKVQNPVAEAYDPVEWKSLWLPISIFKGNGVPVPLFLSHTFHLSYSPSLDFMRVSTRHAG